ncbi:MAG: thioredoxin family protein [Desulfococcaceae bacterium]
MKKIVIFPAAFVLLVLSAMPLSKAEAADKVEENTVGEKFPGLAMDVLKSAKLAEMDAEILLKADGLEIRKPDLDKTLSQMDADERKQWQQNLFFLLEQETGKKILLHQAKSGDISAEGQTDMQIIQSFLMQKAGEAYVSEEEAKAFYDANKEMVSGMPFEQVRESIKTFMISQKKQDAVDSYLASLGENAHIQVNRSWAESQDRLLKDNPVDKARASGRPTMAEFGATGCIPCDMMQPILDNMRKKYGDRLNVVFAHVRENPVLAARFGIRSIPVQVFYDKDGKEVFRHTGFYAETEVVKQIEKLGVK